jgi:hypothetical protein
VASGAGRQPHLAHWALVIPEVGTGRSRVGYMKLEGLEHVAAAGVLEAVVPWSCSVIQ